MDSTQQQWPSLRLPIAWKPEEVCCIARWERVYRRQWSHFASITQAEKSGCMCRDPYWKKIKWVWTGNSKFSKCLKKLTLEQGDQVGRFLLWASFFKWRVSTKVWATYMHFYRKIRICINLDKKLGRALFWPISHNLIWSPCSRQTLSTLIYEME
jgi:hypothetical protein